MSRPIKWRNPTDGPEMDVQALTGHVLGMVQMAASMREEARQRKTTIRLGVEYLDTLTDLQVREHADSRRQPEWWSLGYLLDIILTRDPGCTASTAAVRRARP